MSDLKERRMALGATQAAVAEVAGLKYPHEVGLAERGQSSARAKELVTVAIETMERRKAEEEADAAAAERLEAIIAAIPLSPEWEAFQQAIRDRAIRYLDDVKGECCDAILEFLPKGQAARLLDDYFDPEPDPSPPTAQARDDRDEVGPGTGGRCDS